MPRLRIVARLVSGAIQEFDFGDDFLARLKLLQDEGLAGKKLIDELITDDWAAPPRFIEITGKTSHGQTIDIRIPYE